MFQPCQPACYEIRIEGHLAHHRIPAFSELAVTHYPNGETTLSGPLLDQAALYGLLMQLRDLGITLLAVNRIPALGPDQSQIDPDRPITAGAGPAQHPQREGTALAGLDIGQREELADGAIPVNDSLG